MRTRLELSSTGTYASTVEHLTLDLVHPEGAPSWVRVDGEDVRRFLDRRLGRCRCR